MLVNGQVDEFSGVERTLHDIVIEHKAIIAGVVLIWSAVQRYSAGPLYPELHKGI
jgi:ribulose 1,5-bisphosphate synthetase/thiazole synthase